MAGAPAGSCLFYRLDEWHPIQNTSQGKRGNEGIYMVIGLKNNGLKEILEMWINETENASFWPTVLIAFKARGVEDILIACTNNRIDFTKASAKGFSLTIYTTLYCTSDTQQL
jgi:transposase-like protein